ncbi:superoxide dismutase, copper/zinc binding protein [Flavobacterium limnosediminis JC2902]|uniref:Superoxide dismutase [Cu-Zn] n=1 Tax=Flavobacterium limnosediminis JC2902 TaxID=1341181 RepID=V6SIS0_9FLAO|nr:superoxide dismutase family protein [Flavobacterium limnosediminis]ESU26598.1 superoxide dismutase, copper/zinc binding protein [Flavobacterium limnosediminis JC2902]
MKKITFSLFFIALAFTGCKTKTESKINEVKVVLESKSGTNTSGSAVFSEKGGKVTFTATISGLTPGVHAIHIHEKADCSAADATSAGGHWNPTFKKHGKWGEGEYHKGDIGNFTADEKGNGKITLTTDEWCIGCGDATKDVLGKAIIVHQGADDFVTQPTGNAGGRVACTAIIR